MVRPHEEISYLVRSENRVRVLDSLSEKPKSKREMVKATGVSGVTAGRIIEGFLERGWIRETNDAYATTAVGDLIASDYRRLFESMDVASRLGPVIEHLPLHTMEFDVRHLTSASIADPETFDPLRAMDRQMQLFRGADHVRGFTHRLPNFLGEVIYREVIENGLEFEGVFEAQLVDRILESATLREKTAEAIRAGARIYRAREGTTIPHHAGIFDNVVAIAIHDDKGSMCAGIETTAEPVMEWGVRTFEAFRGEATQLTPGRIRQ